MENCASRVWSDLLCEIYEGGDQVYPRGMSCRELLCHQSVVDMRWPITINEKRDVGHKFMAAEAWWILTGQNRVKTIKDYADISRFSDDDFHFDGAYGPRVVDQVRYVVDTLVDDPHSRQAVMTIWRPNPRASKDIPCTVSLQWLVRDNVIHCNANMRSSDVWLGWPYDVFNFTSITVYILLLMRGRIDKIPVLGNLYLTAGSQHLYETDAKAAREIVEGAYFLENGPVMSTSYFTNSEHLIRRLRIMKDDERGVLAL